MSVDHARNNYFCPVLLSVGRSVNRHTYLFDEPITDKNLTVPDNPICDGVDLAGSDQDIRGLGSSRIGNESCYKSQKQECDPWDPSGPTVYAHQGHQNFYRSDMAHDSKMSPSS